MVGIYKVTHDFKIITKQNVKEFIDKIGNNSEFEVKVVNQNRKYIYIHKNNKGELSVAIGMYGETFNPLIMYGGETAMEELFKMRKSINHNLLSGE